MVLNELGAVLDGTSHMQLASLPGCVAQAPPLAAGCRCMGAQHGLLGHREATNGIEPVGFDHESTG